MTQKCTQSATEAETNVNPAKMPSSLLAHNFQGWLISWQHMTYVNYVMLFVIYLESLCTSFPFQWKEITSESDEAMYNRHAAPTLVFKISPFFLSQQNQRKNVKVIRFEGSLCQKQWASLGEPWGKLFRFQPVLVSCPTRWSLLLIFGFLSLQRNRVQQCNTPALIFLKHNSQY